MQIGCAGVDLSSGLAAETFVEVVALDKRRCRVGTVDSNVGANVLGAARRSGASSVGGMSNQRNDSLGQYIDLRRTFPRYIADLNSFIFTFGEGGAGHFGCPTDFV